MVGDRHRGVTRRLQHAATDELVAADVDPSGLRKHRVHRRRQHPRGTHRTALIGQTVGRKLGLDAGDLVGVEGDQGRIARGAVVGQLLLGRGQFLLQRADQRLQRHLVAHFPCIDRGQNRGRRDGVAVRVGRPDGPAARIGRSAGQVGLAQHQCLVAVEAGAHGPVHPHAGVGRDRRRAEVLLAAVDGVSHGTEPGDRLGAAGDVGETLGLRMQIGIARGLEQPLGGHRDGVGLRQLDRGVDPGKRNRIGLEGVGLGFDLIDIAHEIDAGSCRDIQVTAGAQDAGDLHLVDGFEVDRAGGCSHVDPYSASQSQGIGCSCRRYLSLAARRDVDRPRAGHDGSCTDMDLRQIARGLDGRERTRGGIHTAGKQGHPVAGDQIVERRQPHAAGIDRRVWHRETGVRPHIDDGVQRKSRGAARTRRRSQPAGAAGDVGRRLRRLAHVVDRAHGQLVGGQIGIAAGFGTHRGIHPMVRRCAVTRNHAAGSGFLRAVEHCGVFGLDIHRARRTTRNRRNRAAGPDAGAGVAQVAGVAPRAGAGQHTAAAGGGEGQIVIMAVRLQAQAGAADQRDVVAHIGQGQGVGCGDGFRGPDGEQSSGGAVGFGPLLRSAVGPHAGQAADLQLRAISHIGLHTGPAVAAAVAGKRRGRGHPDQRADCACGLGQSGVAGAVGQHLLRRDRERRRRHAAADKGLDLRRCRGLRN